MADKICLIKQPAGIGDILFCQKIAKEIQSSTEYKHIIWPVTSGYSYLKDYLVGDIEYVDEYSNFPGKELYHSNMMWVTWEKDLMYVPLQTADIMIGKCSCHNDSIAHGHMKYNFMDIDYSNWKDFLEFNRNSQREDALVEKLGLDLSKPYNLINNNYGTYPNYLTRDDIFTTNNYPNIYMDFYEGVNLFDWIKILENAQEIHTVETSLYYILEKLNINNVFIYSKNNNRWNDFTYMKDHCNPRWTYIK